MNGEVRPFNELPAARKAKSDALLLWATTVVLGGAVLVFGGLLVYWNFEQTSISQTVAETASASPLENLNQARQHFIRGESRRALIQARVALALEQQKPSEPSLEKEIRRLIGLADLQQKDYVEAVEHFSWLQRHRGTADDLENLSLARAELRRLNVDALEELESAQKLSTRGVQDRAYAQARQAVSSLQRNQGGSPQVQAGHLVMANIALRQGNLPGALEQLRQARKLGPLTHPQQALLDRLENDNASGGAFTKAQMPVVVPRLETAAAYPQGRPNRRPTNGAVTKPTSVAAEAEEDLPETASMAPPPRKTPRLELPKLEYPNGQNASSGGLPGYQNNNRSSSLPGYNSSPTRTNDRLPGY
ncbi:MAG: hypothetical protein KF760_00765 [Candidatus Eremiobacteraeota bacterium]|nr:hypothetical protein [Candidatus Eremiobacteraeota bacterium]MCW5870073.1 hypothetical protein [Candidatus Eremiobacteraeota bacterium]